jgi:histone H3/H4
VAEAESGQPIVPKPAVVPANAPAARGELARIIQQADDQLRAINPSPFSPQAFDALQERIARYIAELINESAREAKRQQLDTVSETHVERASEYLVSNSGRKVFRHVGTVGGVLLGASISNLLAMATVSSVTFASVGITTALGVVGAFAIALHIARD